MQHELIAKRYIKPLREMCDLNALENLSEILGAVAEAFKNEKFVQIMRSSEVKGDAKTQLILDMVAPANSSVVNNFIKLLAENGRLTLIPDLSCELKREISRLKRMYKGRIYSDSAIEQSSVDAIARDLGNKYNAAIALEYVPAQYDGIRVEVDELNIEINFSKSRLNAQLAEHILKAI